MSATKSTIARPDSGTLHRLYVDEQKGCPEIGRMFERDAKTVLWWLRQAVIPTRPRGSDPAQHFPKGHTPWTKGKRMPAHVREKVRAATVARGGVPYLRGGRHWLEGQPPSANGRWLGGVTPERQAFYRTPEWRSACRAVWARSDAKCERCGRDHRGIDRKTERFDVHHIVSFAVRELRAEPSNLALLCRGCHLFVHSNANTAREFLREQSMPGLFDSLVAEDERRAA